MTVTVQERPAPTVATTETKAKKSLVWVGCLLVALFVGGVLLSLIVGTKERVVGHAGATNVSTISGHAVTTTIEANQTTTKKGIPSDALLGGLLATGAILVLVGLLYGRITVIKLPGGGEIDLNSDEKKAVAETVKKEVKADNLPAEAAPMVTLAAIEQVRSAKRAKGVLDPGDVNRAVLEAAHGYEQSVSDS